MNRTAAGILEERRLKWKSKEVLRRLYSKWYSVIGEWIRPGVVLELGGGSGNLKERFPNAVTSDIVFEPWLDAVLDAQRLPFRKESLDSIVLFDVLHHLEAPALFFSEAERTLKPGGRIVLMEPCLSFSSFIIYRFLHQEGLDASENPLREEVLVKGRDPFQGNQAIPSLIFQKYLERFQERFPSFRILEKRKTDFFLYPCSGGFNHPNLCPSFLWNAMDRLEQYLRPFAPLLAFRIFVALERT